MRITENIKFSEMKFNVQKNTERYFDANEKVVTGKKLISPSDNPAAMKELLGLRTYGAKLDQYSRNINKASYALKTNDLLLERVRSLLSEVKTIAISDTKALNDDTRDIAAVEVGGILEEMLSIANTKADGKYLFSGFKTNTRPFDPADSAFAYNGDNGSLNIAVDETRKMAVNFTGDELFKGAGGGVDILSELSALKTALETNDVAAISSAIATFDTARDQIVKGAAVVGLRLSELGLKSEDMKNFKNNVLNRISEIEDVDLTQAVMEMTQMQTAYEVSLNASASFMQTSLMDFLR
jgi:flagellar hook-associated protein 3 FlgL